jgi:hypothetical protein
MKHNYIQTEKIVKFVTEIQTDLIMLAHERKNEQLNRIKLDDQLTSM